MLLGLQYQGHRGPQPPYDAEVEYLEHTGEYQLYFNTWSPVVYDRDTISFRFGTPTSGTGDGYLFGTADNNFINNTLIATGLKYWRSENPDQEHVDCLFGDDISRHSRISGEFGGVLSGTFTKAYAEVNGTRVPNSYYAATASESDNPLYIFYARGVNLRPAYSSFSGARLYGFTVEGLHDYIPVRFTNERGASEGALFDKLNPTVGRNPDGTVRTDGLYRAYSRSSAAFIIGPDKN